MGLQSWKKEFYPVTAEEIALREDTRSIIAHSVRKWQGLLSKNLKKHRVVYEPGCGVRNKLGRNHVSTDYVYIDSESCSLCQKYYDRMVYYDNRWEQKGIHPCHACPLYKVRGKVACYSNKASESENPYDAFTGPEDSSLCDARPMLKWLKKALVVESRKQAQKSKKAKQARQRRLLRKIGHDK